jgi:hypothetical protein
MAMIFLAPLFSDWAHISEETGCFCSSLTEDELEESANKEEVPTEAANLRPAPKSVDRPTLIGAMTNSDGKARLRRIAGVDGPTPRSRSQWPVAAEKSSSFSLPALPPMPWKAAVHSTFPCCCCNCCCPQEPGNNSKASRLGKYDDDEEKGIDDRWPQSSPVLPLFQPISDDAKDQRRQHFMTPQFGALTVDSTAKEE